MEKKETMKSENVEGEELKLNAQRKELWTV